MIGEVEKGFVGEGRECGEAGLCWAGGGRCHLELDFTPRPQGTWTGMSEERKAETPLRER
jgi:hypothetical protein